MSSPFFSQLVCLTLLSNLAASCGQLLLQSNHELGNFKSDSPRSGVEQSWDPFWAEFRIDCTEDNFDFPAAQSHAHLQPKNEPPYTPKTSAEATSSGLVAKPQTRSVSKKRHAPVLPDTSTMHPYQHLQRKNIQQNLCSASPQKASNRPTRAKKRVKSAAHSTMEAAKTTTATKREPTIWPRRPYTCPECKSITENIYYLAVHFIQQHDTQKCAYTCRYITRRKSGPRVCKKRLANRSTASSHLRVHLKLSSKRGLRLPENWCHTWMTRDPDKEKKLRRNLANIRRQLAQHSYSA